MNRKIVILALIMVLLTGCLSSSPRRYGDLRGYVGIRRDLSIASLEQENIDPEEVFISAVPLNDEEALVGAKITISGERGAWYTDRDGMFYAYNLPVGYKRITISHPKLRTDLVKQVLVQEGRGSEEFWGGEGYYIVIGIENYADKNIGPATGAENDAQSMYQVFYEHTRLPGYVTRLLGAQATRDNIKNAIFEAARTNNPEDYLVLYFAGNMGMDFLDPYDSDGRYYRTAITDSDLEDWLSEFPGYVTVILDGAESDTFADGQERLVSPYALKKPKYTVLSSARIRENAIVVDSSYGKHGLFTHFLIAGLSTPEEMRKSDKNRDGTITAREIFDYINTGMSNYQLTKFGSIKQRPNLYVGSDDNTVILRY